MAKFVVMTVTEVEAEDQEAAESAANLNAPSGAVTLVANSLGGLMNPFHLADAQSNFGHIQPEPVEDSSDNNE